MFGRIMLGLIIMLGGGALMYYSANLVETFGRNSRAESHLGGTRQMWMLFGFGGIVIGGLMMFGIIGLSNPADAKIGGF